MMNVCFIFMLTFSLLSAVDEIKLIELRNLYEQAINNEKANLRLANLIHSDNNSATIIGYKGAGTMILANHVFSPISKLNKFNRGKKLLEQAVKQDPTNLELRYLRLTIQTNVPKFLGYSKEINTDKTILINGLEQLSDKDLKNRIVDYLLKSSICTNDELKKVSLWKNK
ncbi:hypothetical protein [Pedobacter namyangjuensis]|uniref:hypothetical protein n=1 Tax=Pedobacter namyangjuensis TaxID=600626 RepID=UPI0013B4128B|nr:hypothetical protein [Pedobacter namyangjuensis]